MGSNNLRELKKDLKAFAKRVKDFKYTDSALISFILAGISHFSFSAEDTIAAQTKQINTSIKDINLQFKRARAENNRLLKNTNLELIQLMEQGDHVVKSPWSSWQYGINYFSNNWNGTYKGRGDKKEKYPYEGKFERSSDSFERYTSPLSRNYKKLNSGTNKYSASSNSRIGLRSSYGILSKDPAQEPIVELNRDASIRPKIVNVEIPDLEIKAPQLNALTINGEAPKAVTVPTPNTPNITVNLPQPSAKPFTDYCFSGCGQLVTRRYDTPATPPNYTGNGEKLWAGVDINGNPGDIAGGDSDTNGVPVRTFTSNRPGIITYLNDVFGSTKYNYGNVNLYVKGSNTRIIGQNTKKVAGQIGLHTVADGTLHDITANLYGRAAFQSIETWHAGHNTYNNVKVNLSGEDNTVFLIYPAAWESLLLHTGSINGTHNKRGEFSGKVDVTIPENSSRNIIYNALGAQAAFKIESRGDYILEGQGNMVYSGYGYSPNYQNLVGKTYWGYGDNTVIRSTVISDTSGTGKGMIPYIDLTKYVKSYGDDNIILYFGNKTKNAANSPYQEAESPGRAAGANDVDHWRNSIVGIYQGEIRAKAAIGTQLNSSNSSNQTGGNKTGGDNKYVETNVGIFSRSGQRSGINVFRDLGAPEETANAGKSVFDSDPIHALQVNDIDFQFGKYSKSGIMIASEYGTQIDVAKSTNDNKIVTVMTGPIKDYGSQVTVANGNISADDSVNQAATGTIIAYANGKWDNGKHQMSSTTATALNGQPSTINIGKDVELTGRYLLTGGKLGTSTETGINSIAYLAKDGGLVNAEGKTDAKGFYSIIGFAEGAGSTVNTTGAITAKDEWVASDAATKPYKFRNIAGLAKNGGKVNLNGGMTIAGTAGFADGTGSEVNIAAANNVIQTGESSALVALNGGKVEFAGGTIYQEDKATSNSVVASGTSTADHSKSTPFYADSSSKVNFAGTTTINMSDGILMTGEDTDYTAASGTATKYNGMGNVTVNLTGDNVVLRTYQGKITNWTGSSTGINGVKTDMKLANLQDNGHDYKIYYTDGIFNLNSDQDLDNTADEFNSRIGLSNEQFNIASGVTVSSTAGKGLSMASHDDVPTNTTTGYTNNGTVNISGGTASSTTALSTSFGYVDNKGTINVDKGIGAYGINGSNLTNNNIINITSSGAGMAAFASDSKLKTYGTDKQITDGTLGSNKVLEITNNGTITVAGDGSMGLYGNTNDVAGTGLVTNINGVITNNGKIIMTGDKSVGIVSEGAGNTINLGGTGSSDISVGTDGIGVYASGTKSVVNFTSDNGVEIKDKGVGISVSDGSVINSNGKTFEIKYTGSAGASGAGIFYENTATNATNIDIVNASSDKGVVGVYVTKGTLTNTGTITDKSGKGYGIYSEGANVINSGTLNIGNKGKGILSTKGDVTLTNNSVINLGTDEAIGVYTKGTGNTVTADAGSKMTVGNGSYGFFNEGTGNTITSNMTSQSVGDNTVFVFSRDASGTVVNNTPLASTGSLNYGIYSAGNVVNNADINYGSGIGNVGIYSINGGTATNNGATITVGASSAGDPNPVNNYYAIGMAAGYVGDSKTPAYTGNVVNRGIINVDGEYSIGMYGTEAGTTVVNDGTINLNTSNTTGIYLDNGAYGINNGTIRSNGAGLKNLVGVVVKNGSTIENNGTIELDATDAVGLLAKGDALGHNVGKIKNYGTLRITGNGAQDSQVPREGQEIAKDMAGVKIHALPGATAATITVNGVPVVPEIVTTSKEEYKPMEVSTIGMYIDTSNKRFTTPIAGLSNLSTLKNADLIIGTEATQNTTGKYIQVSPNILEPYNQMILNNSQIEKWSVYSGSLTWMANVTQNQVNGTIENAYLAKIPYTRWAGNENTPVNSTDSYNFLDGLEQRYGVEGLGTREKSLFDKLNGIGNNEEVLLYQAADEMMGHQYGNTQMRINATGNMLDKEFRYLKHDWRNPSKQNNKIKVFGMRDEYNTDTAGIIDYTSNAYGVAYVHEDEAIKMGNSQGWYAGAVTNRFKFKDIGHSRENQTQIKAGVFKTMSPENDHNGSLQWTIGGDVFAGINEMKRRYLVVDDIFQAKSNYNSYGAALKTDLGYDIRLSERTHLRPYGALKMEYGKFSNIKEDSGEMRLEIKGNDYFSVKPEAGVEFKYVQPLAVRTNLSVGLTAAYENELGKVGDVNNEGRVRYTNADWFGIRGEKDDRKGNGKFDLNIGVDNTRFGVTVNAGYDTKGKNVRSGVGFRLIY